MNISDSKLIDLYKDIKFIFNNITHLREHLDIIFVFGQETKPLSLENTLSFKEKILKKICKKKDNPSYRKEFLDYVKKNNKFQFLTIESLYADLRKYVFNQKGAKTKLIQIAQLELIAIQNASAILIFPESPGSFTELGYFAAKDETRDKILVLNNLEFYDNRSYVNSVIDLIYSEKDTKPVLLSQNNREESYEKCLKQILNQYDDYENEVFVTHNHEHYMFPIAIIYELIKLFPNLIFSELNFLIKYTFKNLSIEKENLNLYISSIISLLVLSKLVKRKENILKKDSFIVADESFSCFKFNSFDEEKNFELAKIEFIIKEEKGIL